MRRSHITKRYTDDDANGPIALHRSSASFLGAIFASRPKEHARRKFFQKPRHVPTAQELDTLFVKQVLAAKDRLAMRHRPAATENKDLIRCKVHGG